MTGITKKMLLLLANLICFIQSVLSGITTTPGMQRTYQRQTVTFQWSVTGPISSYSVYNQTLGYSGGLNANANTTLNSQNEVVTLLIWNIQLSDAGNYSLSVTTGTTTQTDAGALLFVYGYPTIFVNQTSGGTGQQPATEGDAVELTCSVIPNSLPVAYRPRIYYQWATWIGRLQNISSGPAKFLYSDDSIPGYTIGGDGRTLVIASAQYRDTQGILCYGQEQWSSYQASTNWFYLPLNYRPHIYTYSPLSWRFNAIVGDSVSLAVYIEAFPTVISATNWSFVNTAGHAQDLPVGSLSSNSYPSYSLSFILPSTAYYGNYSMTLSNSIGATKETFQVLGLGPPDAPSGVTVDYVSHYLIAITWNCMWFNGRQQTIFLQLRSMYNDSIIDSQNITLNTGCYNFTSITQFQNGIRPESDYEVRVWSTNELGSSDVVKLSVRTSKVFKFFVSSNTISLNGNQAIVNFTATEGKIARLEVYCCLELTGNCYMNAFYNVNSTAGQVTCDNLQSGDVYVFDFTVYGGDLTRSVHYLTMVNGVRVSRNRDAEEPGDEKSDDEKPCPQPVAIIVLAVLLGVAVLASIGCLLAFLISKRHQKTQPNNSQQKQPRTIIASTRAPQPTTQRENEAYEDEGAYEAVGVNRLRDDSHYTSLEGQRPR